MPPMLLLAVVVTTCRRGLAVGQSYSTLKTWIAYRSTTSLLTISNSNPLLNTAKVALLFHSFGNVAAVTATSVSSRRPSQAVKCATPSVGIPTLECLGVTFRTPHINERKWTLFGPLWRLVLHSRLRKPTVSGDSPTLYRNSLSHRKAGFLTTKYLWCKTAALESSTSWRGNRTTRWTGNYGAARFSRHLSESHSSALREQKRLS